MPNIPNSINDAVKALVCPKVKLPHMDREVYNPSCLLYCSDLCGVRLSENMDKKRKRKINYLQSHILRCKGLCNNDHDACARGVLPPNMLNCPTSYNILAGSNFNFVTFEMRDVETFAKGKPYKTLVKVGTPLDYYQFLQKFRSCIKNALFADF